MYQSRCGVNCNDCQRKEKVGCKGCLNMEKPFWGGVCEVKACCESKKLNHCGMCDLFPCEMEANLGREQGFDPEPRLRHCEEWRKEI